MTASSDAVAVTAAQAISGVRLLEADPELGSRLSGEELVQARRHAVLATVALDRGHWELDRLRDDDAARGEVHGFLMLSGVLMTEVSTVGHACVRLVTPGEIVLLDEPQTNSTPASWGIVVLAHARLAVLDDRVLVIAQRWPRLLSMILKRAGQHVQHGLLQQAISQLPRVQDRLLALLWSIADRQGVVRPDGVWVPMALTHDTLAQMVGARRPTISLGLRSLTEQGVLRADNDGWLIAHDSVKLLSPNIEEPATGGIR
jgi:CRP/FNR family cyclic AMP-dependent transcriptional regulator